MGEPRPRLGVDLIWLMGLMPPAVANPPCSGNPGGDRTPPLPATDMVEVWTVRVVVALDAGAMMSP